MIFFVFRVYFSSENSSESEYDGAVSGLQMVANSECLETKSCISFDPKSVTVPNQAIQAFKFLCENASAQVFLIQLPCLSLFSCF